MTNYLHSIWVTLSTLINVVLFNGSPIQCLSSRAYAEPRPKTMWLINKIIFWQDNHCRGAFSNNLKRAKLLIEDAKSKNIYR